MEQEPIAVPFLVQRTIWLSLVRPILTVMVPHAIQAQQIQLIRALAVKSRAAVAMQMEQEPIAVPFLVQRNIWLSLVRPILTVMVPHVIQARQIQLIRALAVRSGAAVAMQMEQEPIAVPFLVQRNIW